MEGGPWTADDGRREGTTVYGQSSVLYRLSSVVCRLSSMVYCP